MRTKGKNIHKDVANRTNLLGLNISIEAARAGEHGESFNIVAEEMRKLSSSSKISTGKVYEILNNIKESINTICKNIEESNFQLKIKQVKLKN